MINPDVIAGEIRDHSLAIAAVAAVLVNGIVYHLESQITRAQAIANMKLDSGLLTYEGTAQATDEGGGVVYQHDYRLYVRLSQTSFGSFLHAWHDGIPNPASGLRMIQEPLPSTNDLLVLASATPVVDAQDNDYFELYLQAIDKDWP